MTLSIKYRLLIAKVTSAINRIREGGRNFNEKSIKKHKTGSNKSQISCLMIFSWTYNESFNNKKREWGYLCSKP